MEGKNETPVLRIPFSTYDVLGYIIPGVTLLGCTFLYEYWLRIHGVRLHTPVYSLLQLATALERHQWAVSFLYILGGLCGTYVVGHIVSSLSGLLIDRLFVYKGHGYPYVGLLRLID